MTRSRPDEPERVVPRSGARSSGDSQRCPSPPPRCPEAGADCLRTARRAARARASLRVGAVWRNGGLYSRADEGRRFQRVAPASRWNREGEPGAPAQALRRGRVCQPVFRSPGSFRSPIPRSAGRAQWSLRFRAAGRGRPVTVSREESAAKRSWPGARSVILGRRGRRFRRDASASRRNREGEPGASALGSPERPSLPTRLPSPRA